MTYTELADMYSYSNIDQDYIDPANISEYASAIVSMLSDAQENRRQVGDDTTNTYLNAAKLMIDRMKRAAAPRRA
jgi:hypothetical protein